MLLIERICDELLRLIFLAFELEFFAVESIGAAKSRDAAGSRYTCSSDDKNVLLSEHDLGYILQ